MAGIMSCPSGCLLCLENVTPRCSAEKGNRTLLDAQQGPLGAQATRGRDFSPPVPLGKTTIFLSSKWLQDLF